MPLNYKRSGLSNFIGKKNALDRAIQLMEFLPPLEISAQKDETLKPLLEDLKAEHQNMIEISHPVITEEDIKVIKLFLETERLGDIVEMTKKTHQEVSRRVLRIRVMLSDFGLSIGIKLPKGAVGARASSDLLPDKEVILEIIERYNQLITGE